MTVITVQECMEAGCDDDADAVVRDGLLLCAMHALEWLRRRGREQQQ